MLTGLRGAAAPHVCAAAVQNIGLEASLLSEADSQAHSYAAADIKEGIGAIVERRRPVF